MMSSVACLLSPVLPEALPGNCPRAWLVPNLWWICPHVWVHRKRFLGMVIGAMEFLWMPLLVICDFFLPLQCREAGGCWWGTVSKESTPFRSCVLLWQCFNSIDRQESFMKSWYKCRTDTWNSAVLIFALLVHPKGIKAYCSWNLSWDLPSLV